MNKSQETIGNYKYTLFRSEGDLDKDVKKHELVAVEYGDSIDDVAEKLMDAAIEDLSCLPQYEQYEIDAYAPEDVDPMRKVKRYQYVITGVAFGADQGLNALIEYGIIEE